MDSELKSKLKRLVRMIFQDLYVNLCADKSNPQVNITVWEWNVPLAQSNAGSLALTCAGIETFGRILAGYTTEAGVSAECFSKFIEMYFSENYKDKGKKIYLSYRCGFLHSHYLGYNSKNGFFPMRGTGGATHLLYTNTIGSPSSPVKTEEYNRLSLDIDIFAQDFKKAVEKYLSAVCKDERAVDALGKDVNLVENAAKSLKEFPVDNDYELGESNSKYNAAVIYTSGTYIPPKH